MANIRKAVAERITHIVETSGYELYDLDYVKEGSAFFLRVFIETGSDEKIGIEDCVAVTKAINVYLDEEDPIDNEFMLEVTSPGIIRKLTTVKHYERQIGEKISLKFYKKLAGMETKKYEGLLESVSKEDITVDRMTISHKDIAKAETTFEF